MMLLSMSETTKYQSRATATHSPTVSKTLESPLGGLEVKTDINLGDYFVIDHDKKPRQETTRRI